LQRDAVRKHDLCRRAVAGWVAACLSVTFVYCTETAKDTTMTCTVSVECEWEAVAELSNGTIFSDNP